MSYSKFERLPQEKRERILAAAMRDYSEHGHDGASSNRIVKAAGIGKGMLFYYFGSMRGLYTYLMDYAIESCDGRCIGEAVQATDNLLERWRVYLQLRRGALEDRPQQKQFMQSIYKMIDGPDALGADFLRFKEKLKDCLKRIYTGAQTGSTREDVPDETTLKHIAWLIDGCVDEAIALFGRAAKNQAEDRDPWDTLEAVIEHLETQYKPGNEVPAASPLP